ncbi:AraC family transcriptional regulator [Noviherbaspirillum sp. CPCC 100848]|uniref:AraC family transcriptional regulator n=1 Tax=Noviherbaspirillum album TaxID=3080276 RepID=A0ABU6JEK7_9BURK|nr:AraC family transcriptional regulator [Noviherbaspirillum sp. CPCC 100848]MEC4722101.1 AraC family transcriptional regulator [Noviherbaspirillum sp. CPCC 100848]
MKAVLESLLVPEGATWTYFHRRLNEAIPFNWHYHREFELTLTVNSIGQRYVGDTIESYADGDLVLLGSNVPHTWMSQRKINENQPHVAHVFWIKTEWLDALMETIVELRPIRSMLLKANQGIVYSAATSNAVRSIVSNMECLSPTARLISLLEIFCVLADDRHSKLLCPPFNSNDLIAPSDRPRIDRALDYIHKNYQTDISMEALAKLSALSVSGLHRLFKRHTRQTVGEYITQLRIGKACSLLISTDRPVSCIAEEAGYTNLSHFNRQFLAVKLVTPREFRRSYKDHDALAPLGNAQNPYATSTKESRSALPDTGSTLPEMA